MQTAFNQTNNKHDKQICGICLLTDLVINGTKYCILPLVKKICKEVVVACRQTIMHLHMCG